MQIINDPYRTHAGQWSTALGTGLQSLAQGVMEGLAQRHQRKKTATGLQALMPGLSPEQARMAAQLNPKLLGLIIPKIAQRQSLPSSNALLVNFSNRLGKSIGDINEKEGELTEIGHTLRDQYINKGMVPQKAASEAIKAVTMINKSKKLSNDVVDVFLMLSNGDPDKARAMAAEFGFK